MASGKEPDKGGISYMDGIPVKISEKFKPPGKVTLPLSVQRLLNSSSTAEEYDFSLERGVLDKLDQWRKHLETQKEERQKKITEEENWSKMLEETMKELHINEVAPAHGQVTSPTTCDPVLSQPSQEREIPAVSFVSTPSIVTTTDSRYPTQPILTPVPLSYSIPVVQKSHNAFNISDFEADTSSPFDNMELKTINDMEELASVLQPSTSTADRRYYQVNTAPTFSAPPQAVNTTNTYPPIRHGSLPSTSTPFIPTSGASLNHQIHPISQYEKTLLGMHPQLNGYTSGFSSYGSMEQQHHHQPVHPCGETFPYMSVNAHQYPFTSVANSSVIPVRTVNCSEQTPYNYIDRKPLPQNTVPHYSSYNLYNFETRKPWLSSQMYDQPVAARPVIQDTSSRSNSDRGSHSQKHRQQPNGPDFVHEIGELMKKKVDNATPLHSQTSHSNCPQAESSSADSTVFEPIRSLSPSAQQFVERIAEMGFPLPRVARAYTTLGDNGKTLVEYLLCVQALMKKGYPEKLTERAMVANNNDQSAAEVFLGTAAQLLDLGFPEDKVVDALIKFKCDRDKALEFLIT